MLSWLQRLLTSRAQPPALPAIEVDEIGFSLTLDRHTRAFPWQSIEIMTPAFEPTPVVLYVRSAPESSPSGDR